MKNNSRKVVSNQLKRNTKLLYHLKKNYQNDFIPIISKSTLKVFEQIKNYYKQEVPIILDNGCGTGSSSLWLAKQNPNTAVFGIDHTNKFTSTYPYKNIIFAQVELSQLWRLLWEKKYLSSKHIYYIQIHGQNRNI